MPVLTSVWLSGCCRCSAGHDNSRLGQLSQEWDLGGGFPDAECIHGLRLQINPASLPTRCPLLGSTMSERGVHDG